MRHRYERMQRLLATALLLAPTASAAASGAEHGAPDIVIDQMPLNTKRSELAEVGVLITGERGDGKTWVYRWSTDYSAREDSFVVFNSKDELCVLAAGYGMINADEFDRLRDSFERHFGKPDVEGGDPRDRKRYDHYLIWGQTKDETVAALTKRLGTELLPKGDLERLRTTVDELLARKLPHAAVPFAALTLVPQALLENRRLDAALVVYVGTSCR